MANQYSYCEGTTSAWLILKNGKPFCPVVRGNEDRVRKIVRALNRGVEQDKKNKEWRNGKAKD